eukprot:gnl/MRDRNA2_/MRDRNA2_31826_c0_seq1.p2 gnl/MRDRNA2_/MRDRNA2_31826_c0~~gnl/MRDRNA2_/MRDRNA2_31826_c0_seq1.p2  ORF type:complete len:191 (-),score=41.89 gnl/MRDRNA2_/MRDRNA2_31826_c0_seq1:489-1061(-)
MLDNSDPSTAEMSISGFRKVLQEAVGQLECSLDTRFDQLRQQMHDIINGEKGTSRFRHDAPGLERHLNGLHQKLNQVHSLLQVDAKLVAKRSKHESTSILWDAPADPPVPPAPRIASDESLSQPSSPVGPGAQKEALECTHLPQPTANGHSGKRVEFGESDVFAVENQKANKIQEDFYGSASSYESKKSG